MVAWSTNVKVQLFSARVVGDLAYGSLAFALVFALMWVHASSLFVAALAYLQVGQLSSVAAERFVLFCSFCFVLFCSVLFYCSVRSYFTVLFCSVLFCSIAVLDEGARPLVVSPSLVIASPLSMGVAASHNIEKAERARGTARRARDRPTQLRAPRERLAATPVGREWGGGWGMGDAPH